MREKYSATAEEIVKALANLDEYWRGRIRDRIAEVGREAFLSEIKLRNVSCADDDRHGYIACGSPIVFNAVLKPVFRASWKTDVARVGSVTDAIAICGVWNKTGVEKISRMLEEWDFK